MLVGGVLLALTAHVIGDLAGRPRELLLAGVGVATLASGSRLSRYVPWATWQVPRDWSRLGPSWFALAYGAVLGFGLVTMLPSVGLLAIVGAAAVLEINVALLLGAAFGLARAAPALVAVVPLSRSSSPVLDVIQRSVARFASLELVALAALSGVLLLD